VKVLLDENLPHDLRFELPGHDISTVAFMGWQGVGNGELLAKAAAAGFDCMISKDSGLRYEQNLNALPIAVVVLRTKTHKLEDIRPLLPLLLAAVASLVPKSIVRIG